MLNKNVSTRFKVQYPENCKITNDIILKVLSYGGETFHGGKNIFEIRCERKVKDKLEEEIKDMLKT